MNILFLTLVKIEGIEEKHNIYSDLARKLVSMGHTVKFVCPAKVGDCTRYITYNGESGVLYVKTGQVEKTNLIKKGINTLFLGATFKKAICKNITEKFDLIIYSTPPITLVSVVRKIKQRDKAKTYLLLKDIFPQNAVDLGMMSKRGIRGIIYSYFRHVEKELYRISDYIGCMSEANKEYLLLNNRFISKKKVFISPNSIELTNEKIAEECEKKIIREKFEIPLDRKIFLYGGNLGKPQDVPFIVECLKACKDFNEAYFVVCGNGTEYYKMEEFFEREKPQNVKLINSLPRDEYEDFVKCADVGLIFLDHRFTIPNFPSRLLSYIKNGIPVYALTDKSTDIGEIITTNNFGWWDESNNSENFASVIKDICKNNIPKAMTENAIRFVRENYSTDKQAQEIIKTSTDNEIIIN